MSVKALLATSTTGLNFLSDKPLQSISTAGEQV